MVMVTNVGKTMIVSVHVSQCVINYSENVPERERKSIENDPLARVEIGPIWIAT